MNFFLIKTVDLSDISVYDYHHNIKEDKEMNTYEF